jgi:hypothetical protein
MQVGIGGAAGDEYDALRHLLPDPSLGPHDPTTAVELAALMLTRDKGAPTGQPIDALPRLRACVNGAGPMAEAYAARVLADAHAEVQAMIAAGNRINHFPYSYGGAHGDAAQTMSQASPDPAAVPGEENGDPGYDCSSATCTSCGPGGLGQSVLGGGVDDSTGLETVGDPGPGKWTTIYANAGQAYIEIADIYFDTAAGLGNPPNPPATGPRWSTVGNGPDGFAARHPPGL